ncbi:hypothetical protein KP509_12G088500 [Ceratopteris richardii]|uniref:Uncharacterized protein n=1 Tax=Ceratopteris richardii TaxID=49495 RepID=A0A8T2TQL2_CERRI|nr:hypothetical protein KP509_12G088500 [Ceratopteris richardii]
MLIEHLIYEKEKNKPQHYHYTCIKQVPMMKAFIFPPMLHFSFFAPSNKITDSGKAKVYIQINLHISVYRSSDPSLSFVETPHL